MSQKYRILMSYFNQTENTQRIFKNTESWYDWQKFNSAVIFKFSHCSEFVTLNQWFDQWVNLWLSKWFLLFLKPDQQDNVCINESMHISYSNFHHPFKQRLRRRSGSIKVFKSARDSVLLTLHFIILCVYQRLLLPHLQNKTKHFHWKFFYSLSWQKLWFTKSHCCEDDKGNYANTDID